jgi:tetratricopeptide (TPR) repeat protein
VLLAKALELNGRTEEMFEVAQQNQTRQREDFLANLTLGAAWLKARQGEFARARAFQFIAKATSLVDAPPSPPAGLELFYQRGLCFALMGRIAEARENFRRLLALAPGHAEATEALKILETMGE